MEMIYSYTRAQALEDGVLVDVTHTASACGLRVPVAITDTLYHGYIEASATQAKLGQTTEGRLKDVLILLLFNAASSGRNKAEIRYPVTFLMTEDKRETITVKAVIDGGDDGKPVITVMLENED
ncbi:hypothetical protein K7J14_12505 [Treponema zuelzerae]|uniref:Uncharacterized protein n=1 Tax=Teretinema zuelzerae TaxID=156 RepID=A0AAE3EJC9_9SPIR|nr:DUF6573 family protein [Teretinema zuelzerae]MCD1655516.1 hypothetical protein [Teretinema zuelzerae]